MDFFCHKEENSRLKEENQRLRNENSSLMDEKSRLRDAPKDAEQQYESIIYLWTCLATRKKTLGSRRKTLGSRDAPKDAEQQYESIIYVINMSLNELNVARDQLDATRAEMFNLEMQLDDAILDIQSMKILMICLKGRIRDLAEIMELLQDLYFFVVYVLSFHINHT
nr:hypothetical protein Iba_chr14aCG12640 [Ipomoea batatas]